MAVVTATAVSVVLKWLVVVAVVEVVGVKVAREAVIVAVVAW